ncbi:MAG: hypothetical protein V1743_05000 [Nanoarchaeota archaeon]
MAKRGSIVCVGVLFVFLWSSCVAAELQNFTTAGNGYLLIDFPSTVPVNREFSVEIHYFVLNQLLSSINISVLKGTLVIQNYTAAPDLGSIEKSFRLREDQKATYLYTVLVAEKNLNGKEYVTRVPLTVKVVSQGFEAAVKDLFKGIVSGSNATESEDLSQYDPYEYAGKLSYLVVKKNANQVDCVLDKNILYFSPANGFSGNASCHVKAFNALDNATYVVHILVADEQEVEKFNADAGLTPKKADVTYGYGADGPVTGLDETGFLVEKENTIILNNSVAISFDVPLRMEINKAYPVRIKASVTNPEAVIGIDKIDIISHNTTVDCNLTTVCEAEVSLREDNIGTAELVFAVNQIMKEKSLTDVFLQTPDLIVKSSKNSSDLLVVKTLIIPVGEEVKDIAVPSLGAITDITSPEAGMTVEKILKEYQRKKRLTMNIAVEVENVKEISQYLDITKTREIVQRVNLDGFDEEHTVYRVTIEAKKGTFKDFLFGARSFSDIAVFEHIAKESAVDISKVKLLTPDYELILDDPLVVWHFDNLDTKKEVSYEVLAASMDMGNTFVNGKMERGFPNILFALILIPIIALTVIYFDRFKKHPSKEIEEILDRPPDYRELEDESFTPDMPANMPKNEVPPKSIQSMNDFDQLIDALEEYIMHRLKKGDREDHIKQELVRANWPEDIVDKLVEKHGEVHKKKKR